MRWFLCHVLNFSTPPLQTEILFVWAGLSSLSHSGRLAPCVRECDHRVPKFACTWSKSVTPWWQISEKSRTVITRASRSFMSTECIRNGVAINGQTCCFHISWCSSPIISYILFIQMKQRRKPYICYVWHFPSYGLGLIGWSHHELSLVELILKRCLVARRFRGHTLLQPS